MSGSSVAVGNPGQSREIWSGDAGTGRGHGVQSGASGAAIPGGADASGCQNLTRSAVARRDGGWGCPCIEAPTAEQANLGPGWEYVFESTPVWVTSKGFDGWLTAPRDIPLKLFVLIRATLTASN